jgi:hypothetical protein
MYNCITTSHDSEFIIVFKEEMNPIRDARQALLATLRRSSLRDTSVSRVFDVGERLLWEVEDQEKDTLTLQDIFGHQEGSGTVLCDCSSRAVKVKSESRSLDGWNDMLIRWLLVYCDRTEGLEVPLFHYIYPIVHDIRRSWMIITII